MTEEQLLSKHMPDPLQAAGMQVLAMQVLGKHQQSPEKQISL